MKTYRMFFVLLATTWVIVAGCSSGSSAISPGVSPGQSVQTQINAGSQTHLWGLYKVYIDPASKTATAVPDRSAEFSANVVGFLNSKPASLSFLVMGITTGTGFMDVDIDVTITHPFPGATQYNGFDVRAVLMCDGSVKLAYNPKLNVGKMGTNSVMMDDPVNHDGGGPDGYTRWFNRTEFTTPGVLGFTPGKYAVDPGPTQVPATLCPYKYFADGLGAESNLLPYLESTQNHGVFAAGTSATRNYFIHFMKGDSGPNQNPTFEYGVIADWKGVTPADQPANATEAVAAGISTTASDIFFNDPASFGGALKADITVFDWNSVVGSGVTQDYLIKIESSVLGSVHTATPAEMTPIDWGDHWATYHFELPAVQVPAVQGNDAWAIIEFPGRTYKNNFGVTNGAGDDPLASFFHFDVPISSGQISMNPPTFPVSIEPTFAFNPVDFTAPAGSTVVWTNNASLLHTVTFDPLDPFPGGPDSDIQYPSGIPSGSTYSWVVPNVPPGTMFFYHCRFHGTAGNGFSLGTGMAGVVVVSAAHDVSMTTTDTFNPINVSASAGDMVVWTNNDVDLHTAIADPLNLVSGGPDSDSFYPAGMQQNNKFYWIVPSVAPGTIFYYHCRFHGAAGNGSSIGTGMAGSVTVP